mgnify:CR=1 FL=1
MIWNYIHIHAFLSSELANYSTTITLPLIFRFMLDEPPILHPCQTHIQSHVYV